MTPPRPLRIGSARSWRGQTLRFSRIDNARVCERLPIEYHAVWRLPKVLSRKGSVCKTSDFSTHLFKPLKFLLKGEISVHIAVRKSTSKNLHDEMRSWT